MYLDRDEIETTLRIVENRSALGSRLIVAYHQPAWMLFLLAVIVRRLGEPIRTVLTPHQMRVLLARYGFCTRWDRELPAIACELSAREWPRHASDAPPPDRYGRPKGHGVYRCARIVRQFEFWRGW